jgi:hypothetical protein
VSTYLIQGKRRYIGWKYHKIIYKIDCRINEYIIGIYNMIEFVLKNRKLRLHPDGIMYVRAHQKGVETKNGKWKEVKFTDNKGYKMCCMTLDGVKSTMSQHRIVYYAHNQSWDIWDISKDNVIDHINRKKDDNSIENLKVSTMQENTFNTDAKGYSWSKAKGKWQAEIMIDGKSKHLGLFEHEADARNAYIKEKEILHKIIISTNNI